MPNLLDKERLLKQLKVRKVHVFPRLLAELPPEIAARFSSPWDTVERIAAALRLLPMGALQFLLTSPTGAIVIAPGVSRYVRGPQTLRRTQLENVAFVSATDSLEGDLAPLRAVVYLFDHLLGSSGASGGPSLSDGVGITPQWTEVATQIPRLFVLGHNPDALCRRSPADYFACSVAQYAASPRDLNAADPNMHKLLARSFFSENFWRQKNAES